MEVNFQKVKQHAEFKGVDFQTAAKQLGLTEQEARDLEAIGGDPGKNEDGVSFKGKKDSVPEKVEEESSWWNPFKEAAKEVAKASVPVIVGGVIGGILGGAGGAALGAVAAGLLFGASSCTKIDQEVDLQIVTAKNSNDEIIAYLKELGGNIITVLYELKNEIQVGTDRIIAILQGMGFQLDQIYEAILKNGATGEEILKEIQQNNELQNEKLDALSKGNEEIKTLLAQILDAMNEGNKIGQKNNEVLTEILKALGDIKANDKTGLELLEKILAKVTEGIEQNKDMDTKTHELLKVILTKIDTMDENLQAYMNTIIDKLDSLGENAIPLLEAILENIQKFDQNTQTALKGILDAVLNGNEIAVENLDALKVIIEKLDKLGANGQAALAELLNAIKENTTVAKGTYELVKALLEKVDKLGAKADSIIEVIGKIGVGENVDLSKIEEMLATLLEQEKANQKIFNDINSKLNLISVTLQGFAGQIDANNKAVLAKLQEILDKIPEGCKCTHETLDITVLIEKLDKIIEEIKKDPKNEGILGDLGELENMLG